MIDRAVPMNTFGDFVNPFLCLVMKSVLSFLSRNTSASGVETEVNSEDSNPNGVDLNPY